MSNAIPHEDLVIFKTKNITPRQNIVIKEQKGYYQRIRRMLASTLLLLFVLLPFINYHGEQAILFDVAKQTLRVFSVTLYPQDLFIFALVFAFAAFALFWVSTRYGRVWCGYACPQTIWMLLFTWFEFRIEGNRQQRLKLDKQSLSFSKVGKKVMKHFVWLVIATLTALVFMSYFYPARVIYSEFLSMELSLIIQGWIAFFALCTYGNAGFLREKMCEHACPYSRFQSVMFNSTTSVITYDTERGEGRGPRKRNQSKPDALGDCVDCKLCVDVCPVGIDIRDGLQYQCISCGLCIDACDDTMDKFGYQKGLIKYSAQTVSKKFNSTKIGYLTILVTLTLLSVFWWQSRTNFEISLLKDRNALFSVTQQGLYQNSYQLKVLNKEQHSFSGKLSVVGNDTFYVTREKSIYLPAKEQIVLPITLVAKSKAIPYQNKLTLRLTTTDEKPITQEINTVFYGKK